MSPQDVSLNDTYTGDLSESPRPQRRTLGSATIVKMSVGPMDNNVYVITSTTTGDQLIIDAANDADRILEVVRSLPGTPKLI
ncbi:MBL fold metallo-hydrolase, partial [Streptomyces sp. SID10244]|nr:MBL fold metallo-hydrolase [Streptomyces sp. SID10244]